jgi:hypothetical protein
MVTPLRLHLDESEPPRMPECDCQLEVRDRDQSVARECYLFGAGHFVPAAGQYDACDRCPMHLAVLTVSAASGETVQNVIAKRLIKPNSLVLGRAFDRTASGLADRLAL